MLMKNNFKKNTKKILEIIILSFSLVFICFYLSSGKVFAYVMGSGSYRIESDSINISGTELDTSASYKLSDTTGEIASGSSDSTSYKLSAGYRQQIPSTISLSAPSDVLMNPAIGGVSGGTGNGSTSWTVITDNSAGYTLNIKAGSSPAMLCISGCDVGVDSFANYTPTGASPDYGWSITSSASEFGFTPEGTDIVAEYLDDGDDACNSGVNDTLNACWNYLTTSDEAIASSGSATPGGTATTVKFKAQSGSSHLQVEGDYRAIITVTAVMN